MPAWVPFAVGGVGLVAFVARQLVLQRTDRALLDLRTFRSRTFTTATVLMMLMMATLLGTIVLLPIYMQGVLGLDPLATGLLLLPGGLLMGLLGPVVGRLYDRLGARPLLVPGMAATSAAVWSATLFGTDSGPVACSCSTCCSASGWRSCSPRCSPPGSARCRRGSTPTAARSSEPPSSSPGRPGWPCWSACSASARRSSRPPGRRRSSRSRAGMHAAFVVAAVLSLLAIGGAFLMRTPAPAPAPDDAAVPRESA